VTEDNLIILQQKHTELERRHSEIVTSTDLRFNTILSRIEGIGESIHDLDKRIGLFQRDLQSAQSDTESGKRRIHAVEKETEEISSGLLRLRVEHDSLSEALNKRDPVTLWTSISAAATAVGSFVYVLIHGLPKP
jgi:chromosome segregation ATPase